MFKIRTQAIVFGCVLPGHRSPIRMNVLPDKQLVEGWSNLREQRCLCRRKRQLKEELWWPVLTNILRPLLGSWSSGEIFWLKDCYEKLPLMYHHVSLFSPDWDSAANDLNKAAVCFKVKHDEISSSDPKWPGGLPLGGMQSCSSQGMWGIC